jgi:hypothetical protein
MRREAIHRFDLAAVRFAIYPDGDDGPRILADIADNALRDHFGARDGPQGLVEALELNFHRIEAEAIRQYRAAPAQPIRLETRDFSITSLSLRSTSA